MVRNCDASFRLSNLTSASNVILLILTEDVPSIHWKEESQSQSCVWWGSFRKRDESELFAVPKATEGFR